MNQDFNTFIEDNLMMLSKQTFELFIEQDKPLELGMIYLFYYYTAKWQKTNIPRCTTSYVAKGLKISEKKVRCAKKKLIELGLIKDVIRKNEKNKITGWYIQVNYIWKKETINKIHPSHFAQCGDSNSVRIDKTNSLSASRLNTLSADKENALTEKKESDSEETKESSKKGIRKENTGITLRTLLEEEFPEKIEPFFKLFSRVPEGEDRSIKFLSNIAEYNKNSVIEVFDNIIGRLEKGFITTVNLTYIGNAIDIACNKEDDMEEVRGKFKQFCVEKLGEADGVFIYDFYREFFDPKKYHECWDLKNGRDLKFTNNINYLIDTFGKDKIFKIIKEVLKEDSKGTFKYHSLKAFTSHVENCDKFKGPKKEPSGSTELPVVIPTLFKRISNQYEGENEIHNWNFKCTCGAIVIRWNQYCPECHAGLQWHHITMDENCNVIID